LTTGSVARSTPLGVLTSTWIRFVPRPIPPMIPIHVPLAERSKCGRIRSPLFVMRASLIVSRPGSAMRTST